MRIFDLHSDILGAISKRRLHKTLYNETRKGLNGLVFAAFSTGKAPVDVFAMANKFYDEKACFERSGNSFDLRLSYEDLGFVNSTNIHSVLLTRPCMCSLTWNFDNKLAGGSYGHSGLTEFGEKVVKILESEKILIDTAHLNEKSFMDIAIASHGPIVCSHTAFGSVNEHPRNLKDYQIRIILESGGIVGLSLVSYFLSSSRKVGQEDFLRHILYFVDTFGTTDGLAVGTDFFGTKHLPKGIKRYDDFNDICQKLRERGFLDEDIDKIFFLNATKLLRK